MAVEVLEVRLRRDGYIRDRFTANADPADAEALRGLLVAAVRRDGSTESDLGRYELEYRDRHHPFETFTAAR